MNLAVHECADQLNYFMEENTATSRWEWTVPSLIPGDEIDYYFIYKYMGIQHQTDPYHYVYDWVSPGQEFEQSVKLLNSAQVKFLFKPFDFAAGYVTVHYSVNGADQLNYFMEFNGSTGYWEWLLSGMKQQDSVEYYFIFEKNGIQEQTDPYHYLHEGGEPFEEYTKGVEPLTDSRATIWFIPNGFQSQYVTVHFSINDSDQENYFTEYDSNKKRWEFELKELKDGDIVKFYFIFEKNGPQYTSEQYQHVYRSLIATAPQVKGINTAQPSYDMPDPLAGVVEISPPVPNRRGTAELTYPIKIPSSYNGLTPDVRLGYSSDAKDGNCGVGWDLSASTISIKTRGRGVPRYYGPSHEGSPWSDVYLLDGKELVFIGKDGSDIGIYRFKNDSLFWKIEKIWSKGQWVVHRPDGTKMYYGNTRDSNDTNIRFAVLSEHEDFHPSEPGASDKIFKWALLRIEDPHGNTINFNYTPLSNRRIVNTFPDPNNNLNEYTIDLNLSQIEYGEGYIIDFIWNKRKDRKSNGMPGFLVVQESLLAKIEIRFRETPIRNYQLHYRESKNINGFSLLNDIEEYSRTSVVNKHVFEYKDLNFVIESDNFESFLARGYEMELGSLILNYSSCDINGEAKLEQVESEYIDSDRKSKSRTREKLRFSDINGDGHADRLVGVLGDSNDQERIVRAYLNTGKPVDDEDSSEFVETNLGWITLDLDSCYAPVCVSLTESSTGGSSQTKFFDFIDFNGDGFPDIVTRCSEDNGLNEVSYFKVYFNRNGRFEGSGTDIYISSSQFFPVDYAQVFNSMNRLTYADTSPHSENLQLYETMNATSHGVIFSDIDGDGIVELLNSKNLDPEQPMGSTWYKKLFDLDNYFYNGGELESNGKTLCYDDLTSTDPLECHVPSSRIGQPMIRQMSHNHLITLRYADFDLWRIWPAEWVEYFYNYSLTSMLDINGDGLSDRVTQAPYVSIDLNSSGSDSFDVPIECYLDWKLHNTCQRLDPGEYDILGSYVLHAGLSTGAHNVYFNQAYYTGIGSEFLQSERGRQLTEGSDRGRVYRDEEIFDINGDGLPDKVNFPYNAIDCSARECMWVRYNNGNEFIEAPFNHKQISSKIFRDDSDFTKYAIHSKDYFINDMSLGHNERILRENIEVEKWVDMNGDGVKDLVYVNKKDNDYCLVKLNRFAKTNLLISVKNEVTKTAINLAYDDEYLDPNRKTTNNHSNRTVLRRVDVINDFSEPKLHSYKNFEYANGIVDHVEKEFRGFEEVEERVGVVGENTEYVNIDNYDVDRLATPSATDRFGVHQLYDQYQYGTKVLNTKKLAKLTDEGTLLYERNLQRIRYKYDSVPILAGNNNVKFTYPIETLVSVYKEDGTCPVAAQANGDCENPIRTTATWEFDTAFGFPKKHNRVNYQDPFRTDDDYSSDIFFANNPFTWVFKVQEKSLSQTTGILSETYSYDNRIPGDIQYGQLTHLKKQAYRDNGDIETQKIGFEYNDNGLISAVIDGSGIRTVIKTPISYLPGSDLYFRKRIEFADGTKRSDLYSVFGTLLESVDQFGTKARYEYDNHNRIAAEYVTFIGLNQNNVEIKTKAYEYVTYSNFYKQHFGSIGNFLDGQDFQGQPKYVTVETYADPIGNHIQTKQSANIEGEIGWIVTGKEKKDSFFRTQWSNQPEVFDIGVGGLAPVYQAPNNHTQYFYDDLSRLTKKIHPNQYTVDLEYNLSVANNSILASTAILDNENRKNEVRTDIFGRTVYASTKNSEDHVASASFQYTLSGQSEVVDEAGVTGSKRVDLLGRLQWTNTPDAGRIEYFYNQSGKIDRIHQLGKQDDGESKETHYVYDQHGRVLLIDYPGAGGDIKYEYYSGSHPNQFQRGRVSRIDKGTADTSGDLADVYYSASFEYDQFKITEKKQIISDKIHTFSTKYTYDVFGRIRSVTYPDGEIVRYEYDQGQLVRIKGDQEYIQNILYNKYGQKTKVEYGNGNIETFKYKDTDQTLDFSATVNDSSGNVINLLQMDYTFGRSGLLESVEDDWGSWQAYQYDLGGRLEAAEGREGGEVGTIKYSRGYKFDSSNRMRRKEFADGGYHDISYWEGTHAVKHIDVVDSNESLLAAMDFTYDNFGRLTEKFVDVVTSPPLLTKYSYDSNDRLNKIDSESSLLEFKYGVSGDRILKSHTLKKNDGSLDHESKVDSIYASGLYIKRDQWINKNISDGQKIVATTLITEQEAGKTFYFTSNYSNSTVMLTDNVGTVVKRFAYTPYGETWRTFSNDDLNVSENLYINQIFDKESGLYYLNNRYYDPKLGVFTRPDPAMSELNHYAYASGNPIMYSDPLGLQSDPYAPCDGCSQGGNGFGLGALIASGFDILNGIIGGRGGGGVRGGGGYGNSGGYGKAGQGGGLSSSASSSGVASSLSNMASTIGNNIIAGADTLYSAARAFGEGMLTFDEIDAGLISSGIAFSIADGPLPIGEAYFVGSVGGRRLYKGGQALHKWYKQWRATRGATSRIVNTTGKQLQKKFKHASDFGIKGNYNPANANLFNSAINQHLNAPGTQLIQGAYRNSNNLVNFYLNLQTGLNVMTSRTGQFISGAKLSPAQVNDILTKGFLW